MAKNVVVIGTQWGDEGKGKIVDWLTDHAQGVVRFQGGHNAGHTLVVGQKEYKLNLVPSGVVREGVECFIGNGVVLDIHHLLMEIANLEAGGIAVRERLRISPGCPVILPYHAAIDLAREHLRCGDKKIGTTGKGIGPAYEDKVARRGLRVYDLFHPDSFAEKLREVMEYHNFVLQYFLKAETVDYQKVLDQAMMDAETIKPLVTDVSAALYAVHAAGKNLLFEGAQGSLLDIDHGTYPFVTSSSPTAGGACQGAGVSPVDVKDIVGVVKVYTSRVGAGPFPTELKDETGDWIVERGHEYGTTTGRRRRCGWIDIVSLRYAMRVNGYTGLALTRLDVLNGLNEIKLCVAYRMPDGSVTEDYPLDTERLSQATAVYESMPGWKDDISHIRSLRDLPAAAQVYCLRISELLGVPIDLISVGAERNDLVALRWPI